MEIKQKFFLLILIVISSQTNVFGQLTFSQDAALGVHFTSTDVFFVNPLDTLFGPLDSTLYTTRVTTPYVGLTLGVKRKIGQLRPEVADIMVSGRLTIASNVDEFDKLFWQLPVTLDLDFDSGFFAGVGFSFGAYDIKDGFKIRQIGPVFNMGYNYTYDIHTITTRVYYLGNFTVDSNDVYGLEIGYKTNLFRR